MHMPEFDSRRVSLRRPDRRRILMAGAAALMTGGGIRLAAPVLLRGGWILAPGDV